MPVVEVPYLLQEDEVSVERLHAQAEVVDLQTLGRPDAAHALVDVVGGHAQAGPAKAGRHGDGGAAKGSHGQRVGTEAPGT